MHDAVIIDAVRTPIGRANPEKGIYRDVRADDLSALIIQGLIARTKIPPELIEDIQWGCVQQTKEQGYDIARQAVLIAGLPLEIGGVTVNRNCGSSLQAINQAAQSIAAHCQDILIAGGVEHMHHLPMREGFDPSSKIFERHHPDIFNMGLTAEHLARIHHIDRGEQDEWALRSHQRAAAATNRLEFIREAFQVAGHHEDQCIRTNTSLESLSRLNPAFLPEGGTVTAGNSSPLSVGAAAVLMMSKEKAYELGLKPRVKVRSMAVSGIDPAIMGMGPVPSVRRALEKAGLILDDIDCIEINEAFAAQTLAVMKELKCDPDKVNIRGGAIALGHPLGGSGARIATTLIHLMEDQRAKFGLATMCIGGGQGIATIFEKTE